MVLVVVNKGSNSKETAFITCISSMHLGTCHIIIIIIINTRLITITTSIHIRISITA